MSQIDTSPVTLREAMTLDDRLGVSAVTAPAHAPGGKVAVIIPTRGRADIVKELLRQLSEQTRRPDHVFVIGTSPEDISGLDLKRSDLTVRVGREGSSMQRNHGLDLAGSRFSYIVFFDDDFVPSRFWLERMTDLMDRRPDIYGATGAILADGASTRGVDPAEALALVRLWDASSNHAGVLEEKSGYGGNTGCNMAFRYSAIHGIRFDERLPAYGWLEDADFRGQAAARHGGFVHADVLWGVHLGHKKGRGRGLALGYSQIANAVYLARKGTVRASYLAPLALRNILSNLVRSLRPEPFVDRRGRLLGNLLALADILRGRIVPERILTL